jgi:hypothetical protein
MFIENSFIFQRNPQLLKIISSKIFVICEFGYIYIKHIQNQLFNFYITL